MEKEIAKKVQRFIELSLKFSKEEKDIFDKNEQNSFTVIGFSNEQSYITFNYNSLSSEAPKELTRADKIKQKAEEKAKLSDDFDEYQRLQKDLGQYFNTLLKITE